MSGALAVTAEESTGTRYPLLRYEGINRRGRSAGGVTTVEPNPAALAEKLHDLGWREAKVIRDALLVGGVGPHPDTQERTWWGDRA